MQLFQELLNRLQHYNTTVKNDAITDLKEIVTHYPTEVVVPNLCQLIQGVSHLILDREKNVRRESLKLIALILTQVNIYKYFILHVNIYYRRFQLSKYHHFSIF